MNKEISEIHKLYDLILSNKQIIREQEKPKVTNIFGDAEVVVDNSGSGVAPPSGWTKGVKYILKNGGDVYSPLKAKVIATGKLSNTGTNYLYLETSDQNQIYFGNLTSISVVKNQSVDIGNKLGNVARGSYVYICSKNTPLQNIVSDKGDFDLNSSGTYNPSGSILGKYVANQVVSQIPQLNEQRGRGGKGSGEGTQTFGLPLGSGEWHVTSPYGWRWMKGKLKRHIGVDLRAESGTNIIAPLSGIVTTTDIYGKCGGRILINHSGGFRTGYCHVKKFLVQPGQTVNQGDVIGLSGGNLSDPMRGNSEVQHLHYTMYKDNHLVNPQKYNGGQVVPTSPPASHTPSSSSSSTEDENDEDVDTENQNSETEMTDTEMKKKAEEWIEKFKKKIDLSDMSPEEKKKILDKVTVGAVYTALAGGVMGIYKLTSSLLQGVKPATTDTNTAGSTPTYNPSGSKLGAYVGDILQFILPG